MKKNGNIYLLLVFILSIVVISSFLYMKEDPVVTEEVVVNTYEVYYRDSIENKLSNESREVSGETNEEMVLNALIEMRTTPKSEQLSVAVPSDLKIEVLGIDGNVAQINLSSDYFLLKTSEELFCRAAIVWTLTSLDFIDGVELFVSKEPLQKSNGDEFGAMGREDIILNAEIEAEPTTDNTVLNLYFANEDATALVVERRWVEVNPNQPTEKYVIEQLILGPQEEGNIATVTAETKIRDVQTLDGICYVDLSQEFVTKHSGGSTGELLTVYSIVNSLCDVDGVEKVQFLIEGEKQDEFKGHIDFGKPFEANEIN